MQQIMQQIMATAQIEQDHLVYKGNLQLLLMEVVCPSDQ